MALILSPLGARYNITASLGRLDFNVETIAGVRE